MARKTARKTAHRAGRVPGRPFRRGADPRRGHGKKGRSGRKPLAYREWLESMEPQAQQNFEQLLRDRGRPDLRYRASADILDRLHGKASQPLAFSGLADLVALAREGAADEVAGESE